MKHSVDSHVTPTTQDKKQDGKLNVKFHRTERSSTWVQRSLRLPESANLSKISAKYTDGVLQMEVGAWWLLCHVTACLTPLVSAW